MDLDYWETFYQSLANPELDSESNFAHWVLARQCTTEATIIDLGCGNGRDSVYFAKSGRKIIGIDQSGSAIQIAKKKAHTLGLTDLATFSVGKLDALQIATDPAEKLCGYLRFVLHSLSAVEESRLIGYLLGNRNIVEIFIEARTINDPLLQKGELTCDGLLLTDHHRRMIDPAELIRSLLPEFTSVYTEVNSGVSPLGDDDPEVVRLHGRRRVSADLNFLNQT